METKIIWRLSKETSEKIVGFDEEEGMITVKNEDRREFYDVIGSNCQNFGMIVHKGFTTFFVKGGIEVEDIEFEEGRVKSICLGVVRF